MPRLPYPDLVSAPEKGAPLFAQPKRDNYDIIDAASVREATPEEERLPESFDLFGKGEKKPGTSLL